MGRSLGVSPLLAQALLNRGISTVACAESFLEPRLNQLSDPFLLPDMATAVDRLFAAHAAQERITLFGDYDVDGVTASALLWEVLTELGWTLNVYLPARLEEGYGLTLTGAANCLEAHPATLLLAVDCGSTAVETIGWLNQRGVDVIVLDHHQLSDPLPTALALVNPQRAPDRRLTELCSAGLAFKLAHAVLKRARLEGWPKAFDLDLRNWLDLAALGTIADLVPLSGENRILVSAGLKRLDRTARPGLQALKQVAQTPSPTGVYEVAFQLAPRLNASGRLEHARQSLRLLLARDPEQAVALAQELDAQNRQRRQIEQDITRQITSDLKNRFNPGTDLVIVEGQLMWHIGVAGIVASRVLREFYRPTIILGGDGPLWRGSGRSIAGFDLASALRACDDLLVRHGGHALAAGLTMDCQNLSALRTRLNELARQTLSREQLEPVLDLDAEVRLGELSFETVREFSRLGPFGQANPPVQLCARNLRHASAPRPFGKENQHLRLRVTDGAQPIEAVWWNGSLDAAGWPAFHLAFAPEVHTYNGHSSVRLKVLDCRPAHCPPLLLQEAGD